MKNRIKRGFTIEHNGITFDCCIGVDTMTKTNNNANLKGVHGYIIVYGLGGGVTFLPACLVPYIIHKIDALPCDDALLFNLLCGLGV